MCRLIPCSFHLLSRVLTLLHRINLMSLRGYPLGMRTHRFEELTACRRSAVLLGTDLTAIALRAKSCSRAAKGCLLYLPARSLFDHKNVDGDRLDGAQILTNVCLFLTPGQRHVLSQSARGVLALVKQWAAVWSVASHDAISKDRHSRLDMVYQG